MSSFVKSEFLSMGCCPASLRQNCRALAVVVTVLSFASVELSAECFVRHHVKTFPHKMYVEYMHDLETEVEVVGGDVMIVLWSVFMNVLLILFQSTDLHVL